MKSNFPELRAKTFPINGMKAAQGMHFSMPSYEILMSFLSDFLLPALLATGVQTLVSYLSKRELRAKGIWLVGAFAVLIAGIVFLAYKYGTAVYRGIAAGAGAHVAQIIGAVVVVTGGVLAHLFKKRSKLWYGRFEVIFAICIAVNTLNRINMGQAMVTQWATLIGAAYIVARGLNNISETGAVI